MSISRVGLIAIVALAGISCCPQQETQEPEIPVVASPLVISCEAAVPSAKPLTVALAKTLEYEFTTEIRCPSGEEIPLDRRIPENRWAQLTAVDGGKLPADCTAHADIQHYVLAPDETWYIGRAVTCEG